MFNPVFFNPAFFDTAAPVQTVAPAPIFIVTRDDAGTPFTFTAPLKDPHSVERHGMDWSAWLQQGDSIASRSVAADRDTLLIDQVDDSDAVVSWRLRSGNLGQDYTVTCQISTVSGLVDERSVRYRVRER